MDEHAARVVAPVLDTLARVENGTASIAALQASAASAAGALDNANTDLRRALERLDPELELIQFTVSDAERVQAVHQVTQVFRRLATDS